MLENFREMKLGMKIIFVYYAMALIFALMGTGTSIAYIEPKLITGVFEGITAVFINIAVFGIWMALTYGIYVGTKWAKKGLIAWNVYGIVFSIVNILMSVLMSSSLTNIFPGRMRHEMVSAGATSAGSSMFTEIVKYTVLGTNVIILLSSIIVLIYILKNKDYFRN
ncbi:hypothetical protein [Methanococcus voltae]|uniref:Uncharacterized protein n=1 Tax=Methanococcus voltae (strain ATCC BAA-1334 / A3) TaxID=456320 RepID=D7DUM3_METV3|nr:hypothetical protein [Methanococcus voltae]MCS3900634.1 hypothetical protein [Methanococcus voltae]